MTYQAAFEGVRGMLWFTYRWEGKSLPEADPRLWEEHLRIIRELRELEPYLLSEGLGEETEVQSPKGKVRAKVRKAPDGSELLIVLNTSREEPEIARIRLPDANRRTIEVFGEEREGQAREGWIEERFDLLGVHIYRVK